jgi:uncharacterized membrane protein YphA (DoxX/SURF4 family)
MRNARAAHVTYWITTGLLALQLFGAGLADIARPPSVLEGLQHLGYPMYFAVILGTWKVLGAVALVAPRFPRLKEWAYAGIFFDLTGAAASHAATGDGAAKVAIPLVVAAIAFASWALRPKARTLASPDPSPAASGVLRERPATA